MKREKSVIVVHSDGLPVDMWKEGLSAHGYRCEVTPSADDALARLDETNFDVMITDMAIPDFDGVTLVKKAKKLRPHMAVIITGRSLDEASYDEAIDKGISDFLEGPFTLERILVRMKHALLYERLREMSVKDELTGLYNRRGFFTLAEHQLRMANRLKRGVFLLFADFDGLKALNDTYGHGEGDLALVETAELLTETFRDSDIVARIGGDEFVVFPIGTVKNDVEKTVARFRKNLEAWHPRQSGNGRLSLSFGISYYDPRDPCTVNELLVRADRSMYARKKTRERGRPPRA